MSPRAREHLQSAFDRLHEAREYFYPIEARLLDLTLVAPTTLGTSRLRDELGRLAAAQPAGFGRSHRGDGPPRAGHARTPEASAWPTARPRSSAANSPKPPCRCWSPRPSRATFPRTGRLPEASAAASRRLRPAALRTDARRCRNCSADSASPPPCTARSTTAVSPPATRAGFNGKASTARPSRRSAACRSMPAGPNRSSRLAEKLGDAMSLDQPPPWCLPIGRAEPAPGTTTCAASPPTDPCSARSPRSPTTSTTPARPAKRSHYQPDEYRSPYLQQDVAAGRRDPISRWVRYFRRRATPRHARSPGDAMAAHASGLAVRPCRRREGGRSRSAERVAERRQPRGNRLIEDSLRDRSTTTMRNATWIENLANDVDKTRLSVSPVAYSAPTPSPNAAACGQPLEFLAASSVPHPSSSHPLIPRPLDVPAMGFCLGRRRRRGSSAAGRTRRAGSARHAGERAAAAGRRERAAQRVLRGPIRSARPAPSGRSPTTTAAIRGWPSRLPCDCPAAASPAPTPTTRSWRPTNRRDLAPARCWARSSAAAAWWTARAAAWPGSGRRPACGAAAA